MKFALTMLILAAISPAMTLAQDSEHSSSESAPPAQSIPIDQENSRKARAAIDQAIAALGGDAYLNIRDVSQEGRAYSFHRGQPNSLGTLFWRFRIYPDKDRFELTKKRDVVDLYVGDKGYEITYRGVRDMETKDLDPFLRRRHFSLDVVLREWLKQPGVALFYEGQTVAAQKQAEQVTIMNAKNEAVTLYFDYNTHLPIKKSFAWRDPTDKQRNIEEEIFDNYRQVDRVMTPFDVTRFYNGDMAAQSFLTSVAYNQGIDNRLFDPKSALAKRK